MFHTFHDNYKLNNTTRPQPLKASQNIKESTPKPQNYMNDDVFVQITKCTWKLVLLAKNFVLKYKLSYVVGWSTVGKLPFMRSYISLVIFQ
uniref:Uncharacterized protein n=1 Tax=Megaselia scalaris TaxID=36166 RepID=T1H423_MEGSC